MSNHSSLPWGVVPGSQYMETKLDGWVIIENRNVHIAYVQCVRDVPVLLAAPKLLAAAHSALKLLRGAGFTDNTQAIIELKAAIAAAGE